MRPAAIAAVVVVLPLVYACGGEPSHPPTAPTTPSGPRLTISGTATFEIGATVQWYASQTNADGASTDVTTATTWVSDNENIASVLRYPGVLAGVAAGETTVHATYGGMSAAASVRVTDTGLMVLRINYQNPTVLLVGATVQLSVTGYYRNQSSRDLTSVANCVPDDPRVVQVSSTGLATAVGPGTTTVRAYYLGKYSDRSPFAVGTVTVPVTITARAQFNDSNALWFSVEVLSSGILVGSCRADAVPIAGGTSWSCTMTIVAPGSYVLTHVDDRTYTVQSGSNPPVVLTRRIPSDISQLGSAPFTIDASGNVGS